MMAEADLSSIVRGMVTPPKVIPHEVAEAQFRVDYGLAWQEFRPHRSNYPNPNDAARWLATYMRRHYGYRIR